MIYVTRLNGEELVINAGLIEFIESTPDTLISLATGKKVMVREAVEDVVQRVVAYQKMIGHAAVLPGGGELTDVAHLSDVDRG